MYSALFWKDNILVSAPRTVDNVLTAQAAWESDMYDCYFLLIIIKLIFISAVMPWFLFELFYFIGLYHTVNKTELDISNMTLELTQSKSNKGV